VRGAFDDSTQLRKRHVTCDSTAKHCAIHPVEEPHDDTTKRALSYVGSGEAARVYADVTRQLRKRRVSFDSLRVGGYTLSMIPNLRTIHVPIKVHFSHERGARQNTISQDAEPTHIYCPATGKQHIRHQLSFVRIVASYLIILAMACVVYRTVYSCAALSNTTILACAAIGVALIGSALSYIRIDVWCQRVGRRRDRQRLNAQLAVSGVFTESR
jgi:hypothetical protein